MTARATLAIAIAIAILLGCDARTPTEATPSSQPLPAAPSAPTPDPTPDAPIEVNKETGPAYARAAGVEYVELLTGGAKAEDELPLLIAIHGLGDRPEHFAALVRELPTPARVILPRALDPHDEGFSWFPIRARSEDSEGLGEGVDKAGDAIAGLIKELQATTPTLGRAVITGFSQGGMLTFTLAAHHPELVAAAYPVSGWLPPPLWPKAGPTGPEQNPPVVALHGDADRALLIERTRESVAHQQKLGYSVELVEYPGVGHQITSEMRARLWSMLERSLRAQATKTAIVAAPLDRAG
jgi:phospholipase/carboxylesterase